MAHMLGTAFPIDVAEQMGFVSGLEYPLFDGAHNTTVVDAVDLLKLIPFNIDEDLLVANLAFRIVATAGVNSSAKIAIWRAGNGRAVGSPIMGSNTPLATTAVGLVVTPTLNQVLPRGRYWGGSVHTHTAGSLPVCTAPVGSQLTLNYRAGGPGANGLPAANNGTTGYNVAQPFANDIMALDLTGVSLAVNPGSAGGAPILRALVN
jgi:hypothetical protein